MPKPAVDLGDGLPGVALIPLAIEWLGYDAELNNEFSREVLRLGLPAFLPP
jgi:hypothetical protein